MHRSASFSIVLLIGHYAQDAQRSVSSFSLSPSNNRTRKILDKTVAARAAPSLQSTTGTATSDIEKCSASFIERCSASLVAIDTKSVILAALLGSEKVRDKFLETNYGNRVQHFPRSSSVGSLPSPQSGIDMKSLYQTNDWINLRKRGSRDLLNKDQMTYADFEAYISEGGSAVVPIIEGDYMHPFRLEMEAALGQEVSMNIYHSGPSAVALNKHYDTYDVLVLQLEGSKEWIIQADGEKKDLRSITNWSNTTMVPGDVLYIPEGIYHAATTAEGFDTTTHATIGFRSN